MAKHNINQTDAVSQNLELIQSFSRHNFYSAAYHGFGQAKMHNGGLALGLSQFLLLSQLLQKMMISSKEVKNNSKIVISLRQSKSVTHSEYKVLLQVKLKVCAKTYQSVAKESTCQICKYFTTFCICNFCLIPPHVVHLF